MSLTSPNLPVDGIDCSVNNTETCVECLVPGGYISTNDSTSYPPNFFFFTWALLLIVSTAGMINNVIIIKVLRNQKAHKSFDFLLAYLAGVDFFVALLAASGGTSNAVFFSNWLGRGKGMLYWSYTCLYLWEISRSISAFTTVLITLERFLFIRFPQKAPNWFTSRKTKVLALLASVIALSLGVPRFFSYSIEANEYKDIPSLSDLDAVSKPTLFGKFLYQNLHGIHNSIDYWFPPPAVLILQLFSYHKIVQMSKRRTELTSKETGSINAAKMFLPVTIVYMVTNVIPIFSQYVMVFQKKTYREVYLLVYGSTALNSAVNLPIYYFRSALFKETSKKLFKDLLQRGNGEQNQELSSTVTSSLFGVGKKIEPKLADDGVHINSGAYFMPNESI